VSWKKKISDFFSRSREKHKLTFIDDATYREKWSFSVSSMNLVSVLGLYTLLIFFGALLLLKFTPLKRIISDSNGFENATTLAENTKKLDSLAQVTASRQLYLDNLKTILLDSVNVDSSAYQVSRNTLENYQPKFSEDPADSILRKKVESESSSTQEQTNESLEFFFAPVNGLVSRPFDKTKRHFGVDVVTEKGAPIKACLEGSVILTGWVQSEGNIIVVQHKSDLISIYKHCSSILKKQGDKVQAGDPIAIVGNSGENTTGPHLHFELWKRGTQLNPENYISF
jgi:murein DD-endopeptidase MepM/ murein hydrolase activator NlpD